MTFWGWVNDGCYIKIFFKKEIQGKEEVWQENGALVMSMLRWRLPRIDGRR